MFGSDDDLATQIPTQTQSLVEGSASASGAVLLSQFKPVPDVDYLQVHAVTSNTVFQDTFLTV